MIPQKAFILRIADNPQSVEYSETAAKSCEKVGLPYEFYEGISHKKFGESIWKECQNRGLVVSNPKAKGAGGAATAGHFLIWKKIVDENICAVVLEHDALMLHPITAEIPENMIVNLGYKVTDPENYNHDHALQEMKGIQKVHGRQNHGGAHAYALRPSTANSLLKHIAKNANLGYIDNGWFLHNRHRGEVILGIMEPIAAIGWLRASTIWKESAVDNYAPILDSFNRNYKSKNSLNVKDKK